MWGLVIVILLGHHASTMRCISYRKQPVNHSLNFQLRFDLLGREPARSCYNFVSLMSYTCEYDSYEILYLLLQSSREGRLLKPFDQVVTTFHFCIALVGRSTIGYEVSYPVTSDVTFPSDIFDQS